LPDEKPEFTLSKTEKLADSLNPELMKTGLSSAEVERRQSQYGFNEVPEKKTNSAKQFAKKFWGLTAWMLEIIIVLSLFLQRYTDVYIVAGLLIFNSVLGFEEEQRASKAVDALKEKLRVNARVLRDGNWKILPARELVPGDVVRIRSGDFVPADVKVVISRLEVDQSALTGESLTVEKSPGDVLYSGSIVKRGESNGIVSSTGVKTFFGRTAQLVQLAKPKLHLEVVISRVVRWLFLIVAILAVVALAFSVLRGFNLVDTLPIILVLLLSAIPVALPAMFTVSMAIGGMELAKKGVLVTRLSAAEDAATMNVLCVDKTGTITQNKLSITQIIPQSGFSEKEVVLYGALASEEANQDPIDLAFIEKAKQDNLLSGTLAEKTFVPFDPKTRRTEATIQQNGSTFTVMKGAVKVIAEACGLDKSASNALDAVTADYAAKGYRTLAVAKAEDKGKPELVGLATLIDPPRPDSKQLIHDLQGLGISVKMLTGDALPIAKEIAKNVELGENVISASDLKACIREDAIEAGEQAEKSDGFAEVYPEDKYTIVKSLQVRNCVVGMTGDGVNDAPALRQAEVGIAVSNATDVAKGAASVVLVKEGLTSIVNLVTAGRIIYERITAWILSKILRTLQISAFTVLSFLLTGSYVVSAFAVIVYFFLTDFVKIALATDNFTYSQKPDAWNITGAVKAATILGVFIILESLSLLYLVLNYFNVPTDNPAIYTFTLEILFYSAMLMILNVRERRHFWNSTPSRTLLLAMAFSLIVGTVIVTVGIPGIAAVPLPQTLLIFSLSAVFALVLNDFVKSVLVRKAGIKW
jgi:H+-transporting ATPase